MKFREMTHKRWHPVKETPPAEGEPVVILQKNGQLDPVHWTTGIAYFCDGAFYNLQLDPTLGVMRKAFVNGPVEYWSKYVTYDASEVREYETQA